MLVRLARVGRGIGTEEVVFHQRIHGGPRGHASARFSAHECVQAWLNYDKRLFRRLYSELALDEYLPKDEVLVTDRDRRRALLQRGCVMARKMLWDLALADYDTAAGIEAGFLDQNEIAILRRSTSSKYGCSAVVMEEWAINKIAALRHRSAVGAQITAALARGIVWHIRQSARELDVMRAAGLISRFARMQFGPVARPLI